MLFIGFESHFLTNNIHERYYLRYVYVDEVARCTKGVPTCNVIKKLYLYQLVIYDRYGEPRNIVFGSENIVFVILELY